MDQPIEESRSAKRQLILSLVLLGVGVVYALFPIDFIPDFLGPIGWVDDLGVLAGSSLIALMAYYRVRKTRQR